MSDVIPLGRSMIQDEEIEAAAAWLARRACEQGPPEMVADIDHLAHLRAQNMAARMKRDRDNLRTPEAPFQRLYQTVPVYRPTSWIKFTVIVEPGQAQGFRNEEPKPIWTWPEK